MIENPSFFKKFLFDKYQRDSVSLSGIWRSFFVDEMGVEERNRVSLSERNPVSLSGDLAVFLGWGEKPGFLISLPDLQYVRAFGDAKIEYRAVRFPELKIAHLNQVFIAIGVVGDDLGDIICPF